MLRILGALGRLSMTRVVALALAILVVYSLILAAVGHSDFTAGQLLVHLVVLLLSVAVPNAVFAFAVGTKPYWESSLVTAGLLYFLFWPAASGTETWGLVLAGVIASLSKYVLAWRGRHLFNPAALGAFVVGLTGLNAATWWIGTPVMLWLVIPLGLVVLYRAQQFTVAGAFLVVLLLVVTVRTAAAGTPIDHAMSLQFLSQASLFFGAFMLSEPLTLPPRLWQRAVVGAVAGLLFALPFSVALGNVFLSNSPEFVLLLANVVAFILRPKSSTRAEFVSQRPVADGVTEYSFRVPGSLAVHPGQYVEFAIAVPGLGAFRRVFSPVSGSGETLAIATTTAAPISPAKKALNALTPGQPVRVARIGGDFKAPKDGPILLVAGGIGITPLLALARQAHGHGADVVILYSTRSAQASAYLPELVATGAKVLLRTSLPWPADLPVHDGVTHVGSERFTERRIRQLVPDVRERTVLVSGAPGFVTEVKRSAKEAGARAVRTDAFLGY